MDAKDRRASDWRASDWPAPPPGPRWTAGPPRRVIDNPWFTVDSYDAVAPTGVPSPYHVQGFKAHAVGALPVFEDGTVALVGQWRFPFGTYSWEIPEGGSPKTETPLDGAKRELKEETGLIAADWRHVLTMQLSNASSDERAFCFLATGLTAAVAEPDATESIAVVRLPFRRALEAATLGVIQDSMTVAMLLRLHHMAHEGEIDPALAAALLAR